MAYGAYQIAQPTMSLQDQLIRGRGLQDVGAEVSTKKRSLKEDLLEQIKQRQRKAEKRAGSFLGVEGLGTGITTALDFAAGFVDPATAAIMGAVSGGLSGFNQMRAADKLEGATEGFEKYGFLSPQVEGMKSQIEGQQKNIGDVLMSAGTQALQNFAMGKAGEAMSGVKAKSLSGSTIKPLEMPKGIDPASKMGQKFGMKGPKGEIWSSAKTGVDPSLQFKGGAKFGPGKVSVKSPGDLSQVGMKYGAPLKDVSMATKAGVAPSKVPGTPSAASRIEAFGGGAEGATKGYQGAEKAKWLEQGFDFGSSPEDIMSNVATMSSMFAPMLQGLTQQGEQYPQIDFSGLY